MRNLLIVLSFLFVLPTYACLNSNGKYQAIETNEKFEVIQTSCDSASISFGNTMISIPNDNQYHYYGGDNKTDVLLRLQILENSMRVEYKLKIKGSNTNINESLVTSSIITVNTLNDQITMHILESNINGKILRDKNLTLVRI